MVPSLVSVAIETWPYTCSKNQGRLASLCIKMHHTSESNGNIRLCVANRFWYLLFTVNRYLKKNEKMRNMSALSVCFII